MSWSMIERKSRTTRGIEIDSLLLMQYLKLFGIRPIYFGKLFSLHSTDCFHPSLKDHVGSLVSTFGHNIIGTEVFFTSSELLTKII